MKIALITGGTKEREIALKSAKNVETNLTKKHQVDVFVLPEDINKFLDHHTKYDLVIPMAMGSYIEDGKIIGLLEIMNKKFLFSGSEALCICMNKYLTNMVVQDLGFAVPQSCLIQHIDDVKACKVKGKIFVKPNHGGSSIDIGIFENSEKAKKLIKTILQYDNVIIQKAISGREFTVSVIGDYDKKVKPIAITEIITTRDFFDFDAKYKWADTQEITPAQIDKGMKVTLEKIVTTIYKKLKLKTAARIDFIYNGGKFYFIEINTIPGLTDKSLLTQALAYHGYTSLGEFLEENIKNI